MSPDPGFGIPGWFIALFVIAIAISVATAIWRISVARSLARDAGLDPNTATAVTMLSKDGIDATYLASTLRSQYVRPPEPIQSTRTAEQRLQELQSLRDRGLIDAREYAQRRQEILGSI